MGARVVPVYLSQFLLFSVGMNRSHPALSVMAYVCVLDDVHVSSISQF